MCHTTYLDSFVTFQNHPSRSFLRSAQRYPATLLSLGDLSHLRFERVTASHVESVVFSSSSSSISSCGDDVASSASQRANELTVALCAHLVTRVCPSPNTPFHIGVPQSIDPAPAAQLIPSLLLSIRRRRFVGPPRVASNADRCSAEWLSVRSWPLRPRRHIP